MVERTCRVVALALVAGAFGWSADPVATKPIDPRPILKGIEKRYNNSDTLQVNFVETLTDRPRKTTAKGTLYRKKGGKIRWEYSVPKGQLWVSDGKNTFEYFPDEHRVVEAPLKESDDMRAPLAFVMGRIDFDRDFGKYESTADGAITLFARSDQFPYTMVMLRADANFAIRRLTVVSQTKAQIDYQFDGEQLNLPLGDGLFRFSVPPGVEVTKSPNSR